MADLTRRRSLAVRASIVLLFVILTALGATVGLTMGHHALVDGLIGAAVGIVAYMIVMFVVASLALRSRDAS